jgi:hypothetical protein
LAPLTAPVLGERPTAEEISPELVQEKVIDSEKLLARTMGLQMEPLKPYEELRQTDATSAPGAPPPLAKAPSAGSTDSDHQVQHTTGVLNQDRGAQGAIAEGVATKDLQDPADAAPQREEVETEQAVTPANLTTDSAQKDGRAASAPCSKGCCTIS